VTPPGQDWTEASLSEHPAVEQLRRLGYTYVAAKALEAERESLKQAVLVERLARALRRLNPWLSDENVRQAVRAVTGVQAASLLEANQKLYTALTYGISLEQDRGGGKRSHTVRFFDFDEPANNEFIVTRQLKVKGAKKHIIPDIVLFVNGVPIALVECKSPTLGDAWFAEAVEQMSRYQELGSKHRDLGAPRLFDTMQLLVATCGQAASYGTVATPQRFFADWKSPWPKTVAQLEAELGRPPTPQDVLFEGLLAPPSLLDVMRNFVVFERDPGSGKTVRKVCRYQQLAAVNKAIARAKRAATPEERGGVVWHTQGSGKSLTMLWLALKLRRDPGLDNPTLVIVTDRRDLDEQIAGTFKNCGFPNPERADSVKNLRDLLAGPGGKTVLTTVQKFQELGERAERDRRRSKGEHPALSTASNVYVLADEAHRTQYGGLAANLRKALPNACFFGFTGTPIDKNDRSTLQTFGPYIDTYTIEQAVADKATVPIYYEGRLPELRLVGQTIDQLFDRTFADRSAEEREAIKKKYATEEAVAGAPKRIEAIALDVINHYTSQIQPNRFKAQIVAVSRDAAVTYKEALERLHAPPSALVFSGSNDDEKRLADRHTTAEERKAIVERFCKVDDPLSILIVCDMLLTGFDAPVEQVMYLDKPLKEHTLLQAIARVNRVADQKNYGLVVDYWGVSEALQEALGIFSPEDVKGAMRPKGDELPRLQALHAATMRYFVRVRDKDDLNACVAVLEPEDVRAEFDADFKRLGKLLDLLLPDPRALPYSDDFRWLGKVRQAAAARYRDKKLDVSDCGEKARALIESAIVSEGIQVLVKQVSLFSHEFDERLEALKTPDAKASEMEHAVRDEIHVRLDENPAFYASLRERLERIIADRKARRIDAAKQLQLLDALIKDLKNEAKAAEDVGLSDAGFAIYGLLRGERLLTLEDSKRPTYAGQPIDESKRELASLIEEAVAPQTRIVDWVHKDDVQREMRRLVKRHLRAASVPGDQIEAVTASILDVLKVRRGR
jgi:type I restriction enzyme, R subunit